MLAKKDDIQKQLEDLLNDDNEDEDDEEVTESSVQAMKKADLLTFIDDEGLDIEDTKTHQGC